MSNPRRCRMAAAAAVISLVAMATASSAAAAVVISDANDEGHACFKVVTDTATYFYDKAGAGFTSIVDSDGNDWVGYHQTSGASGEYRGIPNMGLNVFGHPGYSGATSTTSDPKGTPLSQATIRSTKGGWEVTWDFFPTHARMTVISVEQNYWLLYEGTPGGAVGSDDLCHRSDGSQSTLDKAWEGDISAGALASVEWVFFADGKIDRSLFMAHDDDSKTDRYYLMNPMTVFGFGRQAKNLDRLLSATPATLVIGLVDSRDPGTVAQQIKAAWSNAPPPPPSDAGPPPPDAGPAPPDAGPPPPFDGGPLSDSSVSGDSSPLGNDGIALPPPGSDGAAPLDDSSALLRSAPEHRLEGQGCSLGPSSWSSWCEAAIPPLGLLLVGLRCGRRRRSRLGAPSSHPGSTG